MWAVCESKIALTRKYSCLQESDKEIFCQKPSYFDDLCVLWQSPAFLIVVQHTGRIALAFLTLRVFVCVFLQLLVKLIPIQWSV